MPSAAALTDGAVDPTVGNALCRLGYDLDFSLVSCGRTGALPSPKPVPGWQSVIIDPDDSTIIMPAGTTLDLGATGKAWAADRVAAAVARRLGCGALVSLGGDVSVRDARRRKGSTSASPTSVVTPPHRLRSRSRRAASPLRESAGARGGSATIGSTT